MKTPEPEEELPLAWTAILADTPVYARDGQQVGEIAEVLGSHTQDIFHGLVVRAGAPSHDVQVPAEKVARITNRRIEVALTAQEFRDLPVYQQEDSYKLGFVGLFRHQLGWVPDDEDQPK